MAFHHNLSHQELPLHHFRNQTQSQTQQNMEETTTSPPPNWLNTALLRTQQPQQHHFTDHTNNFLNLHTASATTNSDSSQNPTQWLSRNSSSIYNRNHSDVIDDVSHAVTVTAADSLVAGTISQESADLKNNINNNSETMNNNKSEGGESGSGGGGDGIMNWQNARCKADILSHPLYDQLLSAHVACLRIATPVDQLPRIDAQLAQSQHVVTKYSALGQGLVGDDKELDQFMAHYFLLLCQFKEQLQQHVRVHAMEAVMACWEIEQSLQSLTGVSPGEGTGATMSDDEDDQVDSDVNLFDPSMDGGDTMGFGPLIPTETERSLMERVRHELKHELKQGYKEKIADIREEIMRKRRAGKLPGDTTSVLKQWWQSHSKWPYPTEEDKARLVQETGLQLKQINNWFINQRKRNWHSNPSTSTVLKSKRKSNAGDNSSDRFA
ncbi:homeobox protein knotted-1-like 3 isoform X2 [Mercurialis annua]|uniref:homeobox protein knotted-1-like 3 isoform X2 n=1 Tax=Mercurialis annua TaxID=3986 RepID=UPI00215E98AA|nr:homeobox protein knotted-1-like 3 isoform X2 [Mercurialis annua]